MPVPEVVRVLLAVTLALVAATAARGLQAHMRPGETTRRRLRSLGTWWVLHLGLVAVLVLGRLALTLAMAAVSVLALRESLGAAGAVRLCPPAAVATAGIHLWGWLHGSSLFLAALPALALALLVREAAWRLGMGGGWEETRWTALAFLVAVAGPAYLVGVSALPASGAVPGSWAGWVLALLVLTELNDMAQAWWGRGLGVRALAPRISPGKTWAGLVGGVATTVLAAALLLPVLTPLGREGPPGAVGPPWIPAALTGLVVGSAGLAGDLSASLLKRRAGMDESGRLLPAHGGVLDRFDSLALTAPSFFFLVWLLWGRP